VPRVLRWTLFVLGARVKLLGRDIRRRPLEIAWVTDIRTAIALGKEYNRPIFLYTGDGRINTGRC